jgi:hypothetical protein
MKGRGSWSARLAVRAHNSRRGLTVPALFSLGSARAVDLGAIAPNTAVVTPPITASIARSGHARPVAVAVLAHLWAAPNTALGLLAGALMLGLGGRMRAVAGVVEFHGGVVGRLFAGSTQRPCSGALTLGHVILGTDAAGLDRLRKHELVHVRQYERWGPLFLPAYALSSAWQLLRGRRGYRDNHFERQAFRSEERGRG